ncbi:NAD-dependent epimerase/dehydratase family protein [bacterium]|nr:NAD-dependent epimerase/dehydratase family protein [bacterium]
MMAAMHGFIHMGFMFAQMLSNKRIFITGGSGFVGAHTMFFLMEAGCHVVALKRENSSTNLSRLIFEQLNARHQSHLSFDDIEWVHGDLMYPFSLIEGSQGCDAIVHTAASVSFQAKEREMILRNNMDGTAHVVTACIENGIERLVHISSVAALPNPDKKPELDETFLNSTYYEFETTYGESKYRSEMEVWKAHGEGVKVTVLNPGLVLGEWKFVDSSVQMFRSVARGLPFYSGGLTGFVDVLDVAKGVVRSLTNEKSIAQRFIMVGENLSYKELLHKIATALGKKPPGIKAGKNLSTVVALAAESWAAISGSKAFITREVAQSANRSTRFNHHKAEEILGINFNPIDQTIARTALFYQAHPELH